MCDGISHRGPDDDGILTDGPVGLGMRRLSIIDLAGGHQPVFNEDRSCAIVYNGEIYNYRELRSWLQTRGHTMRTNSDTETIVHLYEELGEQCVERLRGMFAFAIWDSKRRILFLARDRFGIKPLYFVSHSGGLAFASELKALHAAGVVDGELDWEALESFFRIGFVPAPRTAFRHVRKLEPGHTLTWQQDKGLRIRQYWDVPTTPSTHGKDAVEMVRARFDESVRAHLVADVPVAAFLSGGLDSSAVVSSMALAASSVHAFTVRYHGAGAQGADETPLAEVLARRYGVQLTVVDVEPDISAIFEKIVYALDEPHADESSVPTWLICERVASEFKVALVGTGGDELFAGYRRHFALGLSGAWNRLPRPVRRAASAIGSRLPDSAHGHLGITRFKRFLRSGGDSLGSRYLSLQDRIFGRELFSPQVQEAMSAGYADQAYNRHAAAAPTDGLVRPALYLDYKTYLPDDLLHLSDRISMAHSLELRVPFVDHELVEAVFPLSDRTRVGPMRPKHLLRKVLKPRLPDAHFRAPKRGFIGPTAMWLRHELAQMLRDELAPERLKRLGYFDVQHVQRLLREHMEGRQNHEGILWALLSFSVWHRRFVEARPARNTAASSARAFAV
jgi:asparagine synthase (glutamine-hydrolysing)